jgi:hypothetical protein
VLARSGGGSVTRDNRPLPEPSWANVIATTLRLWARRHLLPERRKGRADRPFRHAALVTSTIAALVAAIAVLAIVRVSGDAAAPAADHGSVTQAQDTAALAAASATRQQAAAWVTAQVSRGVTITCDPLMCAALQQRGWPAAELSVIGPASGDPLGSGIVMSTAAVRSQLGTRLATVYAPAVIATFGGGETLVQIRVVVPGGAAAYFPALRADQKARATVGGELSRTKRVQATPTAKQELARGQVDSRLLMTLAALAHQVPVRITSFGGASPGSATSDPVRIMIITVPAAQYLPLVAFLHQQRAPLLAAVSAQRHGRTALIKIGFTEPSPVGLLNGTSQ